MPREETERRLEVEGKKVIFMLEPDLESDAFATGQLPTALSAEVWLGRERLWQGVLKEGVQPDMIRAQFTDEELISMLRAKLPLEPDQVGVAFEDGRGTR